jgi:hypothetical protein
MSNHIWHRDFTPVVHWVATLWGIFGSLITALLLGTAAMIGGFDDYVDFAARKHGPWVYLAYLILLFAGYGLFYWVRGIYRHGPKAFLRMRPRDLKDVQQLFYSYAEPARNGAYGIINTMVRGVSGHPNANVKAFIQLFQSRAPDCLVLKICEGLSIAVTLLATKSC